jgi:hypothetical protein
MTGRKISRICDKMVELTLAKIAEFVIVKWPNNIVE